MEAIVECCAGLDVHQAAVVACLNKGPADRRSSKEIRTYGTTGQELREMTRKSFRVESAAMMSSTMHSPK